MRDQKTTKSIVLAIVGLSPLLVLPFLNYPSQLSLNDQGYRDIASLMAKVFGFSSLFLLTWQHVFANRYFMGQFIKDLKWVTDWHKRLAIYGIVAVLAHPALLIYNYGWNIVFRWPEASAYSVYLTAGKIAVFLFLLVWLTSALLRSRLKYRTWKFIHYLSYVVTGMAFVHVLGISRSIDQSRPLKAIVFLLTGIMLISIILKILNVFNVGQKRYRLVAKTKLNSSTQRLKFEPVCKRFLDPEIGQYIYIKLGRFSESHPFTVAEVDHKTKAIYLVVRTEGKFTKKLAKLRIDSQVYMDGPYGYFTSNLSRRRANVLLAGGIGVTPFISHALQAKNQHIFLFCANQDKQRAIYTSKFKKALGKRYVEVYVDEPSAKNVEQGYINADIIRKYIPKQLNKMDFYICGPPMMVQMVEANLIDNGVDPSQINKESFSF